MRGMRITAGTLRGRRLNLPAGDIRPTSSRAREAVFNILANDIPGSRFLDLFAGSGVMSIEAISRGAGEAVAVELSGKAAAAIGEIAKAWSLPIHVRRSEALRFLASSDGLASFDVVYADPPYDFDRYDDLVTAIDEHLPLSGGAVVVLEHRKKNALEPPAGLTRLHHRSSRSWGQIMVEIYDTPGAE